MEVPSGSKRLLVDGNDQILEALHKTVPFKVVELTSIQLLGSTENPSELRINLEGLCDGLAASPNVKSLCFAHCTIDASSQRAAQLLGALVASHLSLESIRGLGEILRDDDDLAIFFEGLRHNTTLKLLDMSRTCLSERATRTLKEVLPNNSTLEDLNMTDVTFTPQTAHNIVEAIRVNRSLKSLTISNFFNLDTTEVNFGEDEQQSEAEDQTGCATALKNRKIDSLVHDDNGLESKEPLREDFPSRLLGSKSLTTLNLGSSEIFPSFGENLKNNRTLTSLLFKRCFFDSPESVQTIDEALTGNTTLRTLEFYECFCLTDEWKKLKFNAFTANTSLTKLTFSGGMSSSDTSANIEFLAVLKGHKSIRTLELSFNNLLEHQVTLVKDFLTDNATLTDFNFSGRNCDVAHIIFEALHNNTILKAFTLEGDVLPLGACKELSAVLQANGTLQHLKVSRFPENGARYIVEGLKNNTGLISLDVEYRRDLSANQIFATCTSLQDHPSLTSLTFRTINTDSSGYFGRLLRANTTLQHLHIDGGTVDPTALSHICNALQSNTTLRSLHLFYRGEPSDSELVECMNLLHEALRVNESVTEYAGEEYLRASDGLEPLLRKNIKLRTERINNAVTISHNIVRSHRVSLIACPIEVWKHIFSFWKFPGVRFNFGALFQSVVNKYK